MHRDIRVLDVRRLDVKGVMLQPVYRIGTLRLSVWSLRVVFALASPAVRRVFFSSEEMTQCGSMHFPGAV